MWLVINRTTICYEQVVVLLQGLLTIESLGMVPRLEYAEYCASVNDRFRSFFPDLNLEIWNTDIRISKPHRCST